MRQNPLLDLSFLKQLDKQRNRITYARVTSLTNDQYPIERIEGIVTAGSINIDGKSAVRRVCNLTITTDKLNINNIYWGLSTRVKIEIGLENNVISTTLQGEHVVNYRDIYPEIIWFPQGVFILNSFKTNAQTNKYQITLTGKDKMCLLNGDIGGNFNAETQLDVERVPACEKLTLASIYNENIKYYIKNPTGTYTLCEDVTKENWVTYVNKGLYTWDGSSWYNEKKSLYYIIREMIHHYAQESFQNIIIKDIDTLSYKILNNRKQTFYLIHSKETDEIIDIYYQDIVEDSKVQHKQYKYFNYPALTVDFYNILPEFQYEINVDEDNLNLIPENKRPWYIIDEDNKKYTIIKIDYGEDLGYELTETYYPDELIGGIGETVTSILDKIVKTFGDYEYFYNLDGQFVFQRKQTYVNTSWNNEVEIDKDEYYIAPEEVASYSKYAFESGQMTTAYQNAPNLGNIKNDFTVWGTKKSASGLEIPIHMRYAIDHKAEYYHAFNGNIYISEDFIKLRFMPMYNSNNDYVYTQNDEELLINNQQYKIVDWREIIYQMAKDYYEYGHEDDFAIKVQRLNIDKTLGLNFYEQGKTGYEQYYHDIEGFWRSLYAPKEVFEKDDGTIINIGSNTTIDKANFYETISNDIISTVSYGDYKGPWNKQISEDPSSLIFWFDFFESENLGVGQFSVPAIGDRPKNKNNDQVQALIYQDVPDVIFITQEDYNYYLEENKLPTGYSYIIVHDFFLKCKEEDSITISTRSLTAQQEIDDLLYNYAYCNETITITAVPIYYLEPNIIISAKDEQRMINGYYIINKITLPLDYKGTMKITAIKVPERIGIK